MGRFYFFLLIISITLFSPLDVRSEFYKYTDEEGNAYYVDDKSKIPLKYGDKIKVYKDKYDHLSEEEKAIKLERERKEREERYREQLRLQEEADRLNKEWERKMEEERELRRTQQRKRKQETLEHEGIQRVKIVGDSVLVPVILGNGREEIETLLLLDTGATMITIHQKIADRLKLKASRKINFQVAGGKLIDTQIGKLSYVKAGPIERKNLQVSIIEFTGPSTPFTGLLGMNFLRGIDYKIDFQNKTIRWNQ